VTKATKHYTVHEYVCADGVSPFREWLDELPVPVRARIQARVTRFEMGNLGDRKPVGGSVFEARFHFGPGYRLYFGIDGLTLIILLCGGEKSSQRSDVRRAKQGWQDYLERRDA